MSTRWLRPPLALGRFPHRKKKKSKSALPVNSKSAIDRNFLLNSPLVWPFFGTVETPVVVFSAAATVYVLFFF